MAALIYSLCAITSLVCAVLLLRGYARSKLGLLMWSGLGSCRIPESSDLFMKRSGRRGVRSSRIFR